MSQNKQAPRGSEFWQIFFPALAGLILIGLLCAWVVVSASPGMVSQLAEISTLLLVIPIILVSSLAFFLFGGLIYLVQRLIQVIPPLTKRAQEFLQKIQAGVSRMSELIIKPVIQPSAIWTGIRNIFSRQNTRYRIE
jgi:hypothetical protein